MVMAGALLHIAITLCPLSLQFQENHLFYVIEGLKFQIKLGAWVVIGQGLALDIVKNEGFFF